MSACRGDPKRQNQRERSEAGEESRAEFPWAVLRGKDLGEHHNLSTPKRVGGVSKLCTKPCRYRLGADRGSYNQCPSARPPVRRSIGTLIEWNVEHGLGLFDESVPVGVLDDTYDSAATFRPFDPEDIRLWDSRRAMRAWPILADHHHRRGAEPIIAREISPENDARSASASWSRVRRGRSRWPG